MARIAGVDLPNKAVKIALTYIYGYLYQDQHRS